MYYTQGPGSYFQWYIPVRPHPYPNYPVDPNHPQQWVAAPPYGNVPLLNGRQSETDGEQESNADDERSGGGSFPPPGVGLPPASTMQQQPIYQMMPPFSSMYSLPSGVNMPGFVNSPMAYPHPYQAGIPAGNDMNPPPPPQNNSRSGRSIGKSSSSAKGGSGEKGSGINDLSLTSNSSLTQQDSSSSNDPSTPNLTPALAPQHPPTNFMPLAPVQYSYPYFPPGGPPPPHMTSAQHATGSPLYLPHPSVPVFAGPIYSSGPATVFSTDNGMPHSTVSAAPVTMHQPHLTSNNDSESSNYAAKEMSPDDAYKNSNLMADSPPFEQGAQKNSSAATFGQENVSTSSDVASENTSLPNNTSDQSIPSEVPCSTDKDDSDTEDHYRVNDNSASSSETASCLEQPLDTTEKSKKAENIADMVNSLRVKDECKKGTYDKESDSAYGSKNGVNVMTYKNGVKVTSNSDISSILSAQENGVDGSVKSNDAESNESKDDSTENMNGKSNASPDTVSSKTSLGGAEMKNENAEEVAPAPSTRTYASLFHHPSSSGKSKVSAPMASKPAEMSAGSTTTAYAGQNADSHSSATSFSNAASMNGMPPVQSLQSKAPMYSRYSSMSSSSLADDTSLPKIGGLLKNYRLDHKAANFEPRGLENRSNCCYVNAILQALLACPPFYNLMRCISTNLQNPKTKAASRQHFPIIESMAHFVEEFKPISQKVRMREKTKKLDAYAHQELVPGKPFEPSSMLSVIQGNSLFTVGQQEDAQEFLTCLLNGLNDEMVELIQLADGNNNAVNARKAAQQAAKTTPPMKNNKKMSNGDISTEVNAPDDSDSEWKQVSSKAKSNRLNNLALTRTPLSEIFRGQTRSRLQKIGDQTTNNIEPFFTLHLNIEKVSSVKEALESLFGQSALEGVTSSRTNQEVDAWQQQTLEELPYVLLLHLKYFDFKHHTCTKILKNTEFPIDLKVEPKLISLQSRTKTVSTKSRQYKLFAVVYHDGKEATKGHYVTDVFHIGHGGWIRYDDAKVYSVSESDVLKPQLPRVPYLLYYRRCDTIAALMQPPFEKRGLKYWRLTRDMKSKMAAEKVLGTDFESFYLRIDWESDLVVSEHFYNLPATSRS